MTKVGYFTLFSKQSHSRPHQTAPPSLPEVCFGKKLREQVAPGPQCGPYLSPYTSHILEQNRCYGSLGATPLRFRGPSSVQPPRPGPQPQVQNLFPSDATQGRAESLHLQLWGC